MPSPVVATVGASLGSALIGSKSASKASNAQVRATEMQVAEQRAAREELRRLLEPYRKAGLPALQEQMRLLGLEGGTSQRQAYLKQEASPGFREIARQGELAILQNASATGGLRGGNVQGALAQFRPGLLNQYIDQQFSRLGTLSGMGQNAAAGTGIGVLNTANQIGAAYGDMGAAQAGQAVAQGRAWSQAFGNIGGILAGSNIFGGGLNQSINPVEGIESLLANNVSTISPIERPVF